MIRNEERLGRAPPREEQIRRQTAPMREAGDGQGAVRGGADAGTASPGTPPTNAADVDSEIPRLGTDDGASYNEPVGSSMMGDAVPEDGMPGLH